MRLLSFVTIFIGAAIILPERSNALLLGSSQNIIVSPSVAKANFLELGKDLEEAVEGGGKV